MELQLRYLCVLTISIVSQLLAGCSFDTLAVYCTDRDATFHFQGASPPLKPGTLDKMWDQRIDAIVFEAVPDFTFTDLGDLGPTYILMVNYGNTDLAAAMNVFKSYLGTQGYCGEGECEPTEFTLGENSGQKILWRMESYGYQWYARDYMFKRDTVLYHISVQSIRRENRSEYDHLVESFTPGPPPVSGSDCVSEITMPTYNPNTLFR